MKDLIEEIDSRIKAPLFGYFLFALIAINWDMLFFLFVDVSPVPERITHFKNGTNIWSLFVQPISLAAIYSIIYPWMNYVFMCISTKPTELRNALNAQSEHRLLIKKGELEEARDEILKNAEVELIERAKRDKRLDEIEDKGVREKLQLQIATLRKERDEMEATLNNPKEKSDPKISKEQEEIITIITKAGGSMLEKTVISKSRFDKVKTEYLLEDLEEKNYVSKSHNMIDSEYTYKLQTISKKLMMDKGVVN